MNNRARFPLGIQLPDPIGAKPQQLVPTLSALQALGYCVVELNCVDFSDPLPLIQTVQNAGLRIGRIATGAWAAREGLSLCSQDPDVRFKTVRLLAGEVLPFAQACHAQTVLGLVKGGPAPGKQTCTALLAQSLRHLCSQADCPPGSFALEATNHYETAAVHQLHEAAALCPPAIDILPDLYHMNIEEASLTAPLVQFAGRYRNIHFSDNNRYFPGFGRLDFLEILRLLDALDYPGDVTLEGRIQNDLLADAAKSAQYLFTLCERM